jgi:hypothetical protein
LRGPRPIYRNCGTGSGCYAAFSRGGPQSAARDFTQLSTASAVE